MTDTQYAKERLDYLIEKVRIMAEAIDNEAPDMALWEIRRVVKVIDSWKEDVST